MSRFHRWLEAPPMRSTDAQSPMSDLDGTGPHRCASCGREIEAPDAVAYCIACHKWLRSRNKEKR